jgi:uncharacterized sporulation protein YeaH/YhbH (DUF444 family)
MRIIHLRQVLAGPERFIFAIWNMAVGQFVDGTEWIVVAADSQRLMVERLKKAVVYFSSQQCIGVSSDVQQIMERYGVSMPSGWTVYPTKR